MKLHSSNIFSIIIFITVTAIVIFPLYIIFFVEPSFTQFIIKNTEKDAAKLGRHLSNSFFPNSRPVDRNSLSPQLPLAFNNIQSTFDIIKIKLFNTQGEIIHSSDSRDIGTMNTHDYFHSVVSKGEIFSKIVLKNKTSLEARTMPVDVVEVYIPIMHGPSFAGAFEIYYDITTKRQELSVLINRMTKSALLISLLFLGAVIWATIQAQKCIKARFVAENDLKYSYDTLEMKVTERTKELTKVNEALGIEITIRKETEEENEQLITDLRSALNKVKTLSGLLPICSSCQQIRDGKGKWSKVDEYIQTRTDAEFTHGICPNCAKKLYPDLYSELDT